MTDPNIPTPAGKVTETTTVTTKVEAPNKFSRYVEDAGFLAAIILISLWCFNAILRSAGYIIGPCRDLATGFPWEFVILCLVLVIPKTVGRGTAGRIWEKIAGRT